MILNPDRGRRHRRRDMSLALRGLSRRLLPVNGLSSLKESSQPRFAVRTGSTFRDNDVTWQEAFPNYKKHLTHRKHFHAPHTYGVFSLTRLRVVDNSKIGREAMAEGKPPKVIHIFSDKHWGKPHGTYGKLGDKVTVAIKGQVKQGIIVGVNQNQLHGVPRFDSNNVVLIDEAGSPLGTRIHVPIPNCIRKVLKHKSHPKKADYTKLLAIASRFV